MAKQEEISGPADFLTRGDSSWTRPTGPGGCPDGGSVPSPGHAVGAWRGGWHPGWIYWGGGFGDGLISTSPSWSGREEPNANWGKKQENQGGAAVGGERKP